MRAPVKINPTPSSIILMVTCLHFAWGIILRLEPTAAWTTSLGIFTARTGEYASSLLFVSSIMAVTAILSHGRTVKVLLLLPQQAILQLAAGTVIVAVIRGAYADGTLHPPLFILQDQFWVLLLVFFHAFAIVQVALRTRM
jgi:hypothetical protein